jgi:ubiquinone/menaquinone biosynthesis C-methylase UbiE
MRISKLKPILIVPGITLFLCYLALFRIIKKLFRFPSPPFIGWFLDSDLRRWLQPPDKIIERSGIKPGMKVLDLGCGNGAYTNFVARAVGEQGKVYAVDIQSAMLHGLERKLARAQNQDITNVEMKKAHAYDLPFEDESIDLVYMVTVLQEIPDRGRALREVSRILKPGGILAVTEILIDSDYPLRSTTIELCQREGFSLDNVLGNFWHYTVRLNKPSPGRTQTEKEVERLRKRSNQPSG